jgi:hypothetical protein
VQFWCFDVKVAQTRQTHTQVSAGQAEGVQRRCPGTVGGQVDSNLHPHSVIWFGS